jgi:hypothetical protein
MEVGKRGTSPKREDGAFSDGAVTLLNLSWPWGKWNVISNFDDSFPHGFPETAFDSRRRSNRERKTDLLQDMFLHDMFEF